MSAIEEHFKKKGLKLKIVKEEEGFWGTTEKVVYPKEKEESPYYDELL